VQYVRLGSSGLKVSRVCLGMMSYGDARWRDWVLDQDAAAPIVRHAAEAGINFFDTANVYSHGASEEITGRLLSDIFDDRDDYVLATKVRSPMGNGPNDSGLSRKHILTSIDASLRRLGTDHVDLYQIHRWDYETPIEETMATLDDIVRVGKARYIGASSMFAWQFAKANHTAELHGWTGFVSMQNHYNLLYREEEREMIPLCLDLGIGIIPWSPLARGWLAGTRKRSGEDTTPRSRSDMFAYELYDETDLDVVDTLIALADQKDAPPAQIALAWLLHRPAVVAPVVGATKTEHVADAIAAIDIGLSDNEIQQLEAPYRPHPIRGHT
jgi:aryl-alcohol dehydrogenase-like predicted oxidoreductase